MSEGVSSLLRFRQSQTVRYVVAVIAAAIALATGRALQPVLGDYIAYVAIFPALAFCAWYCGLGPSVLAAVLCLLGLKFWFISPVHSFNFVTLSQAFDVFAALLAAAAIVAMGEARRRENEALRLSHGDLEERVRQRTAQLDTANDSLRRLTASLMQLQDDERRRIARELHDSVGQSLAALAMNLTAVGTDVERLHQTAKTIADSATLVQEMNKEVRTISYLLHPPLLDEAGLVSALRWYIDGFSQRSKIQVLLEVDDDFGRLSRELETGIFRTVQECLTNIHRHSGSDTAKILLSRSSSGVLLQVEDEGRGFSPEKLEQTGGTPGVGIRGMRERLRQLGGSLKISSNPRGTVIEARLPFAVSSTAAA